jgi:DNA-directed RNA polymerase subunit RPC12/RpoP
LKLETKLGGVCPSGFRALSDKPRCSWEFGVVYKCSRCGRAVEKLVPIDDAYRSIQYTELVGVPYPCTDYVCITCAKAVLEISDDDIVREERLTNVETEFILNLLKGGLAKAVVEAIFREFGYEVYPFGYESHLTNIIKFMKKGDANIPVRKVRATPDLFVYDRELNDGYFIEIKATTTPYETKYWVSKLILDSYLSYWPEAILVVYCIPSMNIYCRQVSDITPERLIVERSEVSGRENYVVNLKADFFSLPDRFRLINPVRYQEFCQRIKSVLQVFGQH